MLQPNSFYRSLHQACDFRDIMDLTEGIIQHAAAVHGDGPIDYQGTEIEINEPFRRVRMMDAIKKKSQVLTSGRHDL